MHFKTATNYITLTKKVLAKSILKGPMIHKEFLLQSRKGWNPLFLIKCNYQNIIWLGEVSLKLEWDLCPKLLLTLRIRGFRHLFSFITCCRPSSIVVQTMIVLRPWFFVLKVESSWTFCLKWLCNHFELTFWIDKLFLNDMFNAGFSSNQLLLQLQISQSTQHM